MTDQTKVLIVDNHPAVREALAIRIARQTDMEICGEAADTIEALRLVDVTRPDVVVVEILLKDANGIDLIKRIRDRSHSIKILVWSLHSESLYGERALRAGAAGYISKDQGTERIIDAIRWILEGKIYLSEEGSDTLLRRALDVRPGDANGSPLNILADRELEVFRLIGQGRKTVEIANQLHLSVKTIETYRDRIRQKLKVENGTKLSCIATQWVLEEFRV